MGREARGPHRQLEPALLSALDVLPVARGGHTPPDSRGQGGPSKEAAKVSPWVTETGPRGQPGRPSATSARSKQRVLEFWNFLDFFTLSHARTQACTLTHARTHMHTCLSRTLGCENVAPDGKKCHVGEHVLSVLAA